MSNTNPDGYDSTAIDLEKNAPAEVVDKILQSIEKGLLKKALQTADDNAMTDFKAAVMAFEIEDRISDESLTLDLPAHLDPREICEGGFVTETTDAILQRTADELHTAATQTEGDTREFMMEVIGEFDSRIGGGY